MLLGPVFRYELYSIARRTRYFWLRGIFGALLLFVMWMCYTSVSYRGGKLTIQQAAELAHSFFLSFAWISTLAILMIGPALSAGVIATERERRTIEYLFATDLRNSEIVLSKLAARLLLLGLLLMTALPVLAIFRLMGGISGDRLIACFLMLASTALVVTSASIAISVWSPRGRDALGRVYLVIIAALLIPLLLGSLFGFGLFSPTSWLGGIFATVVGWLYAVNPLGYLFAMSMSVGFDMKMIWQMLVAHGVLSVALIALSVASVRRVHLRNVSGNEGTGRRRRWTMEFPRWRRPLGDRPMLWKEVFARTAATKLGYLGRFALFLIIFGLFGWLVYVIIQAMQYGYRHNWFDEVATAVGMLIGSGTLLLCGARAATLVTYEKERDTWLSILSTPMSGSEILTAKLLGNLYAFRWLAAVILLIWILAAVFNPAFLIAVPLLAATLVLVAFFATLVGLFYSLRLSSSLRASSATMATLFFVGGGYFFCCCLPFMFDGPPGDLKNVVLAPCVPFLLYAPSEMFDRGYGDEMASSNYVLGMIGYFITTVVLGITLYSNFDKWSGRIDNDESSETRRQRQTERYASHQLSAVSDQPEGDAPTPSDG